MPILRLIDLEPKLLLNLFYLSPVGLKVMDISYLDCTKKQISYLGCRHSSVDLSVPSILPPWVQVQAHNLRFYHV